MTSSIGNNLGPYTIVPLKIPYSSPYIEWEGPSQRFFMRLGSEVPGGTVGFRVFGSASHFLALDAVAAVDSKPLKAQCVECPK